MQQIIEWMTTNAGGIVESLLHSLWVCTAVGLVVWLLLRTLPVRRANLRYGISVVGMLLCVVGTFAVWSALQLADTSSAVADVSRGYSKVHPGALGERSTEPTHGGERAVSESRAVTADRGSVEPAEVTPGSHSISVWLLSAWFVGAAFMLLRTLTALLGYGLVQSELAPESANVLAKLQTLADRLCERMRVGQSVRLFIGDKVKSPAVLGFFKPVVLIPPAMLTGIQPDHWELILAHELAHVRRYDALVNLAQMLVESVLFFNPAVWWLSRQIRSEREACCDAVAAKVTGQSLEFARVLLNVASGTWQADAVQTQTQASAATSVPSKPALAMSFAEETEPGSLRDRVTRLAEPHRATAPRFTRVGLFAALFALLLGAVAVQQGTSLAVDKVADLLTPSERVEQLARFQAESTGALVAPAVATEGLAEVESHADPASGHPATAKKFDVSITVRTKGGEPVPPRLRVGRRYVSMRGNRSYSYSGAIGVTRKPSGRYEKTVSFPPCQFVVTASVPGYAPVFVGRTLFEDKDASPIELVLEKGFEARVVLSGEDGRPLSNAEVSARMKIQSGNVSTSVGSWKTTADEKGMIALPDCADGSYELKVKAAGYQRDEFPVRVVEGATATVVAKLARPTVLKVVDAVSGKPVPGAVCVEQCRTRGSSWTYCSEDPRRDSKYQVAHATSDAEGELVLDQLNDEMAYTMAIRAEGYGTVGLFEVRSGAAVRTVRLSEPVTVSGRITKGVERLPTRGKNKTHVLAYKNPLGGADDSNGDWLRVNVAADGTFVIGDVVPGVVEFELPGVPRGRIVEVTESITKLELAVPEQKALVRKKPIERAMAAGLTVRKVILRLGGSEESTQARGNLNVSWSSSEAWVSSGSQDVPLSNNQVEIEAPVGARLRYEPANVVGLFVDNAGQTATVVEGDGPQLIEVAALPAGGVHGRLVDLMGEPVSGFITVYPADESWQDQWGDDAPRLNSSVGHSGNRFFRTLPFGSRYVVAARSSSTGLYGVSEPFLIDGTNPIQSVQIAMSPGETVKAMIRDAAGQPVANAPVALAITRRCLQGMNSFDVAGKTDSTGLVEWKSALPRSVDPISYSAAVDVRGIPGSLNQRTDLGDLDLKDGAFQVPLQAAVSARGVVIDAATDRPVPNAVVAVYPRNFSEAEFRGTVETKTDAKGEFEFSTLEPIDYRAMVRGAAIKGTLIETSPNGGYRLTPPDGSSGMLITGGSDEAHRLEVELIPGGELKPLKK